DAAPWGRRQEVPPRRVGARQGSEAGEREESDGVRCAKLEQQLKRFAVAGAEIHRGADGCQRRDRSEPALERKVAEPVRCLRPASESTPQAFDERQRDDYSRLSCGPRTGSSAVRFTGTLVGTSSNLRSLTQS